VAVVSPLSPIIFFFFFGNKKGLGRRKHLKSIKNKTNISIQYLNSAVEPNFAWLAAPSLFVSNLLFVAVRPTASDAIRRRVTSSVKRASLIYQEPLSGICLGDEAYYYPPALQTPGLRCCLTLVGNEPADLKRWSHLFTHKKVMYIFNNYCTCRKSRAFLPFHSILL